MFLRKLSLIFLCRVIRFETICVNNQLFVVLKFELSVAGTLQTDNAMWPRPFRGQFDIFVQKICLIEQHQLSHLEVVRLGCCIILMLRGCCGIFVVQSCNVSGQVESFEQLIGR